MKQFFTLTILFFWGFWAYAQQPCSTLVIQTDFIGYNLIEISVLGGNPPYVYLWDDNITTEDRSVSQPNRDYCLVVTDANGCLKDTFMCLIILVVIQS